MNILGNQQGMQSGIVSQQDGSNQYGSFPTLQNMASAGGSNTPYGAGGFGLPTGSMGYNTPYPVGSSTVGSPNWFGNPSPSSGGYGGFYPGGVPTSAPGATPIGGGFMAGTTYDPALTSNMFGFLQSQIGQGLPQYPGQLTAPPNVNLQNLSQFLAGGQSNIPGMNQLAQYAQTGLPFNTSPLYQSLIQEQQQNIGEQAANLKESMSAGGNLVGSPYGTTMQDFYANIGAQQNALNQQLQMQSYNQAQQNQLGAIGGIMGQVLPTSQQLQGIQQGGLSNAYQAWLQQLPQYNPLLGLQMGAATTFPSYLQKPPSGLAQGIGALAGTLIGSALPHGSKPNTNTNPTGGGGYPGSYGGYGGTPPFLPGNPTYNPTTPDTGTTSPPIPSWGYSWDPSGSTGSGYGGQVPTDVGPAGVGDIPYIGGGGGGGYGGMYIP